MFGVRLLLRSYLKPLPLNLDNYVYKKKHSDREFSIQLKNIKFPIHLRKDTTDVRVFNQVFDRNEYDINFYSEPKIIIDCGANIGMTSVYFANKFPSATIIAIEPEKANYKMLLSNTESYQNIHCLNCGLWNKKTNLEVIDRGEGSWGFIVKETQKETPDTIKAVSVDEIMKMFKLETIDVLKIDIEGSEKEVFEQGSENWLPYVNVMVIELHDTVKVGCTKAMIAALKNHSYSIEPFCESIVVRVSESIALKEKVHTEKAAVTN